jgi:Enoyl-CoA hydratase/isomerase
MTVIPPRPARRNGDITKHAAWDCTVVEGSRVMQPLVELEMPIVAAVNGPASAHSDYVLLADIVIAADTTVFSDFSRLTFGIVPGDGIHFAWEEAIGLNRARYLTLTQGWFTAQQAERWGAVAEVLPLDQVLPRALELAESLAARPQLLTRHLAVSVRQRLSHRVAEGVQLGMALEGLTVAALAYQHDRGFPELHLEPLSAAGADRLLDGQPRLATRGRAGFWPGPKMSTFSGCEMFTAISFPVMRAIVRTHRQALTGSPLFRLCGWKRAAGYPHLHCTSGERTRRREFLDEYVHLLT